MTRPMLDQDRTAHFVISDQDKLRAIKESVCFFLNEDERSIYQKSNVIASRAEKNCESNINNSRISPTLRQAGFSMWSKPSNTWNLKTSDPEKILEISGMTVEEIEKSDKYKPNES